MSDRLGRALSEPHSDSSDETPKPRPESLTPRSKRRRFTPLKVANQIPKRRRREIERALEDSAGTPKKWSRQSGPKNHNFMRKRISPGSIRRMEFDLLSLNNNGVERFKNFNPSHLYYFATPFIFSGSRKRFDVELYQLFSRAFCCCCLF